MTFDELRIEIDTEINRANRVNNKKVKRSFLRNWFAPMMFSDSNQENLRQFIVTQVTLMKHFHGLSPVNFNAKTLVDRGITFDTELMNQSYHYKKKLNADFLSGKVTKYDPLLYSNLAWKIFPAGSLTQKCLAYIVDYITNKININATKIEDVKDTHINLFADPNQVADDFIDDLNLSEWLRLVALAYEYDVANNKINYPDPKKPVDEVWFFIEGRNAPVFYPHTFVKPTKSPAKISARAIGYLVVGAFALALAAGLVIAGSALIATGVFFPLGSLVAFWGGTLALTGTPLLLAELAFTVVAALGISGAFFGLGAAAVKMTIPSQKTRKGPGAGGVLEDDIFIPDPSDSALGSPHAYAFDRDRKNNSDNDITKGLDIQDPNALLQPGAPKK